MNSPTAAMPHPARRLSYGNYLLKTSFYRHLWQEKPLMPADQLVTNPRNRHQTIKAVLLECQRCQLEQFFEAEDNHNLDHQLSGREKCRRVHQRETRAAAEKRHQANESETDPHHPSKHDADRWGYAVCGYSHHWRWPDADYYEGIINQPTVQTNRRDQLPRWLKVNCPDCLNPGTETT